MRWNSKRTDAFCDGLTIVSLNFTEFVKLFFSQTALEVFSNFTRRWFFVDLTDFSQWSPVKQRSSCSSLVKFRSLAFMELSTTSPLITTRTLNPDCDAIKKKWNLTCLCFWRGFLLDLMKTNQTDWLKDYIIQNENEFDQVLNKAHAR